jgi:rubredoxin
VGSLVFQCDCGFGFRSSTDSRSYAAHVLPDRSYDEFSGLIDDAIAKSGPTPRDKDEACMAWRRFRLPMAWQCPTCGTLFVEDASGRRHHFTPASPEVPTRLFAPAV